MSKCADCVLWTPGKGSTPYGLCRPVPEPLPFWAARWQEDMQTQTLGKEGDGCEAFRAKGA